VSAGNLAIWEGYHENSIHSRVVNDCRCRSWWCRSQHPDPDVKAVVCHSGVEWRIYIKDGDKEFHAIEVFEAAYDCWANFIYTNRIAANQDPFDEI
jgi:hypothetical protein